jgi:hypothetical protein
MITLVSNRDHRFRVTKYQKREGYVAVEKAVLVAAGKRKGFEPADYWSHALWGEQKLAIKSY